MERVLFSPFPEMRMKALTYLVKPRLQKKRVMKRMLKGKMGNRKMTSMPHGRSWSLRVQFTRKARMKMTKSK
jgi:hypothetical protein